MLHVQGSVVCGSALCPIAPLDIRPGLPGRCQSGLRREQWTDRCITAYPAHGRGTRVRSPIRYARYQCERKRPADMELRTISMHVVLFMSTYDSRPQLITSSL